MLASFVVLLLSAPTTDGGATSGDQGKTRVVYAGPEGQPEPREFGWSLWGARIAGREVVAIGALTGTQSANEAGEVVVFVERKPAWRAKGRKAGDRLGHRIAAIDRECTGVPDAIALGAEQSGLAATTPRGPGRVELRRLSDGEVMVELRGQSLGDGFGSALCDLGDIDGDGFAEVAIGATHRESGNPGYVSVVSSKDGALLWTAQGSESDRGHGAALARIGDVDGDGKEDLLVGIEGPRNETWGPGRIAALSAASGKELYSVVHEVRSLGLGSTLASIEDQDGDGCADAVALGIHPPESRHARNLDVLLISGASGKARSIATLDEGWGSLAVGRGSDGCPVIAVGLPLGDERLDRHGGAVALILPSGERAALIEADSKECVHSEHPGCPTGSFGKAIAFLSGSEGGAALPWIVGSPSYFWNPGFVAFLDGKTWSTRQVLRQPSD